MRKIITLAMLITFPVGAFAQGAPPAATVVSPETVRGTSQAASESANAAAKDKDKDKDGSGKDAKPAGEPKKK